MKRNPSSIGMILAKLRYQFGWTQAQAVARMNSSGFYMTRHILGNLETGRGVVKHVHLDACLEVYRVDGNTLFPPERRRLRCAILGLTKEAPTRNRRRSRERACRRMRKRGG
jgi:transcriptional regulator with XRE-family HTH domain